MPGKTFIESASLDPFDGLGLLERPHTPTPALVAEKAVLEARVKDLEGRVNAALEATLAPVTADTSDMPAKVTEDDMLRALWRHFYGAGWFPVPQVSTEDEQSYAHSSGEGETVIKGLRRCDLLLVRKPSKDGIGPVETLAIEVKVTKADWKSDLDNPGKQAAWRNIAHRHAYAVPAGLIYPDEVPEGSGLLTVSFNSGGPGYAAVDWARRAPYPTTRPERHLLPGTIRTMFARLSELEARTRGWYDPGGLSGSPEELRAALVAANKAAERAMRAQKRAEGQRNAWMELHARTHPAGAPCIWCGEPVKGLRPTDGWFKGWRHVDSAADEACIEAENASKLAQARIEYDEADTSERNRRLRRAEWNFANYGKKFPDVDVLEKEPWRAFDELHNRIGPFPAELTGDDA